MMLKMRVMLWTTALTALVMGGGARRVAAHGMHAMHAMEEMADVSSSDYKCPVCRMSTKTMYNNENWVEMANGQRVYTCGMEPRQFDDYDFKSTDTAYLGANMAEFIVNESDKENYACDASCPECATGIKDPISGAAVTTDNFKFVCLANGQKIYFASADTRKEYLSKVNQTPRVAVSAMTCEKNNCSDATKIQTLSALAKAFKPDTTSSNATTPAPASSSNSSTTTAPSTGANTNAEEEGNSGFCSGEGSVMFNGFSSTVNGSCVMLFFKPWVLNSALKYVFGFLGCLGLSFGNEYLVKFREQMRKKLLAARKERPLDKMHRLQCKLLLSLMYMIQMTVAYFAMLVVMTYETGLFIALILGFGAGFIFFKEFDVDVTNERGVWRYTDPSVVRLQVDGMSCMKNCGTTVENALLAVPGVSNAMVDFDERSAYVTGVVSIETLIQAVEAVGFSARSDSATTPSSNV
ncbi:hypothetical protein Poli38472_005107 [Pythium oligandrum]|uniref:Copper transport protein n=1 Tax=Pythium oligandrum TaxID=41045 RepID=A0A8K1FIW2_PYTOL|nr:hypothetical protein Poli38472_005107 [Pythium oligandrum]|eukprot:TMW62489.1 hypothetical protein Poli38472_005107 [Pythium oligandrum]